MTKTITVKGIGNVSAPVDLVVILMTLESRNRKYDVAMDIAGRNIDSLNTTLESVGFEKKSVKTTGFNVNTEYESIRMADGNHKRVFKGYTVIHNLKLEFDFDTTRLSRAISAIGNCPAQPELSVRFTIKDPTAVSKEMLRAATINAREKAEVLCEASNKKLGELIRIDYNWGVLDVYSDTRYCLSEECIGSAPRGIDFEPDDIKVSDTATFVWEIAD